MCAISQVRILEVRIAFCQSDIFLKEVFKGELGEREYRDVCDDQQQRNVEMVIRVSLERANAANLNAIVRV